MAAPRSRIRFSPTIANVPQFFDVAQDPFNALHLIAVAATGLFTNRDTGGEVWVSNDAGTNWSVSTDNFVFAPETTVGAEPRSVLFDAVTPNVVYFATTLGVFKSSSGGTSPSSVQRGSDADGCTTQRWHAL